MTFFSSLPGPSRPVLALVAALLTTGACAAGPVELPRARPLVIHSGARLAVDDEERMREVYESLQRELEAIENDPSFMIEIDDDPRDLYPWETLEISGDTARIAFQRAAPDLLASYEVYAHLHLMRHLERLDEWLPEVAEVEGWQLERAIMDRVTDIWLLGRTRFDLAPYELMDQMAYAQDAGYLDALLLTLRASEFREARAAWMEANPGVDEAFRAWYRETFEVDPPIVIDG
jgi:hypothetical protein